MAERFGGAVGTLTPNKDQNRVPAGGVPSMQCLTDPPALVIMGVSILNLLGRHNGHCSARGMDGPAGFWECDGENLPTKGKLKGLQPQPALGESCGAGAGHSPCPMDGKWGQSSVS